ncbi:hypothetical protein HX052_09080 [Myroides marinus]|uniref:hypothetical protein n=1 Tax=Myroides marinus TaxID=703342 RepID=UPI0025787DD6|nr:hypothetical protein [Myroides marinus]MDM1371855.1 hypothetical protein [Myroides marinus]MDM1390117.1 hypothetical protein [Myroides marinus]MDM1403765.1 hypothetical protein [Myroides marinus]MDM1533173.1 hypothetical protein [Myroides marinus]MDM1540135.1 hypothetical protein [Myroides marinus]
MEHCIITSVTRDITKEEVEKVFGKGIEDEVLKFWNTYECLLYNNGIALFGFDEAIERNSTYEVNDYVPDYYMIGNDSGGTGIFLKRGDKEFIVYYLGLGALGSLPFESLGISFFEWIENDPILEEEEEFNYFDIIVTKKPAELTKFIFDLKKEFDLTISLGEIKKQIEEEHFVVRQNLIEGVYKNLVDRLNQKYDNCISYKVSKI